MPDPVALKPPVHAALTLSFVSLGDAFMYPFLPQHAGILDIPVVWIGILLSINRFIRLLLNPFIYRCFHVFGIRSTTIAAAGLAILSTLGYALNAGLPALLLFRILWGIAYAILRISALAYAVNSAEMSVSLGVSRGLQELGPLIALWAGPLLLEYFPGTIVFLYLGAVSMTAMLFSWQLPPLAITLQAISGHGFTLFGKIDFITFLISFLVDGLLVICIGMLINLEYPQMPAFEITRLAAISLACRRICFIVFAPVAGWLATNQGSIQVFTGSVVLLTLGFILVLHGGFLTGLALIFSMNAMNNAVTPALIVSKIGNGLNGAATNVIWRDMGAATGTLAGGYLL